MWSKWLTVAVLGAGFANVAMASHGPRAEYVYATVVSSTPIVRQVVVERPREECWQEEVVRTGYAPDAALRVAGATVAGGIIGGAIGRELGHGRNRDALAVVGTLVGSALANQTAQRNQLARPGAVRHESVPVERCHVVSERYTEERIEGYLVTYRYHGRRYTMRTRAAPGPRVRLSLSLRPIGYGY